MDVTTRVKETKDRRTERSKETTEQPNEIEEKNITV